MFPMGEESEFERDMAEIRIARDAAREIKRGMRQDVHADITYLYAGLMLLYVLVIWLFWR